MQCSGLHLRSLRSSVLVIWQPDLSTPVKCRELIAIPIGRPQSSFLDQVPHPRFQLLHSSLHPINPCELPCYLVFAPNCEHDVARQPDVAVLSYNLTTPQKKEQARCSRRFSRAPLPLAYPHAHFSCPVSRPCQVPESDHGVATETRLDERFQDPGMLQPSLGCVDHMCPTATSGEAEKIWRRSYIAAKADLKTKPMRSRLR